jgi:hypothetical protein
MFNERERNLRQGGTNGALKYDEWEKGGMDGRQKSLK